MKQRLKGRKAGKNKSPPTAKTAKRSGLAENEKNGGSGPVNGALNQLERIPAELYLEAMARSKTKAGKAVDEFSSLTVEDWDKELVRIGDLWRRAFVNRQLQAQLENSTVPPPPAPSVDGFLIPAVSIQPKAKDGDFDITTLVELYRSDERSAYRKVRHATRSNYDANLKRLCSEIGDRKLSELTVADVEVIYAGWIEHGHGIAHALLNMLRMLIKFGGDMLEDGQCARLSLGLRNIKTEVIKPRTVYLTEAQADLVRKKAHEMGLPSIALAQAFQFECKLRQKDVIGEWVPLSERVPSDVIYGGLKWIRGVRWEYIDDNYVLRHVTSRGQERVERDLKQCRMVREELKLADIEAHSNGPIVVSETTDRPYTSVQFRRLWRRVADAAGVPKDVKNMDSNNESDDEDEGETNSGRTAV